MGVLQTGEIFRQAPSVFWQELQVHMVLSGENHTVRG